MGRLHSDIFAQHHYMLSRHEIKIRMPSKDALNLMAPDKTGGYRSIIKLAVTHTFEHNLCL